MEDCDKDPAAGMERLWGLGFRVWEYRDTGKEHRNYDIDIL